MARRKDQPEAGVGLFELQERQRALKLRRQRALFIPRLLADAASGERLAGEARDRAFEIATRWADRESSGRLKKDKETTIDTQFLDQLFGEGLGYKLKTASPDAWHLEHKFSIPAVGTADAALGDFPAASSPTVVIELKGATTDLDRDRSNGRTAVQQGWDYRNALPDCTWVIVSNFATLRLYHRDKGTLTYEEFSLQELRNRERFNQFYYVFERNGLLPLSPGAPSRAVELLQSTKKRQKQVGDELYLAYQKCRLELIEHLCVREHKSLDASIRVAQKLLDRIIFIAFCEDRGLLPANSLETTHREIRTYSRARNPAWESFLDLFAAIDKGAKGRREITAYNGGLFADDPEINGLELAEARWTNAFASFGQYDFSEEVNVEVLGHLFERSITELEKLRVGGLPALKSSVAAPKATEPKHARRRKGQVPKQAQAVEPVDSKMSKSAQRKRFGIYYTPPEFTGLLVERTVDVVVTERLERVRRELGVDLESREGSDSKLLRRYWQDCLESLKSVTVCDPACGSGAFLIRAYDALEAHYTSVIHGLAGAGLGEQELGTLEESVPDWILTHNLYGVDQSEQAVEITQLALWIRSARRGRTLAKLSNNIVCGNSLVADAAIDPKAMLWGSMFPSVFAQDAAGGFTCVIGNPPWERVKVQDREFFSLTDPETAEAVSASERKKRIAAMPTTNPALHASYLARREQAQRLLDYTRLPEDQGGRFPLTGRGDVNLYMLFAELASSLVARDGLVGVLVPSGIATDDTTKEFFNGLMESKRLVSLYDFENRKKVFEDVDGRFKFSALVFGGAQRRVERADFVFFAHAVEEIEPNNKERHIPLTAADMALVNPNTKTCPIFRTRRDADLTKGIYKRVPILLDWQRKQGGNPWGLKFFTMFHQTNDAEKFVEAKDWQAQGYKLDGNVFKKDKRRALPLYEAKMVQAFDHRAASVTVDDSNWIRQGQKAETSLVQHQNPEFTVMPRWWVDGAVVSEFDRGNGRDWMLAYKDITSPTNVRTMIASFLPRAAVVNSAPLMSVASDMAPRRECCLLANLNATVLDFVARQKVGGVHLNFFIVEQLPILPPAAYEGRCPWSKKETLERWISERVLKLTCTADDLLPLAHACDFKGSRGDGVHAWKEPERALLRAELDAAYFLLYGLLRNDVEYILSTFTGTDVQVADDRVLEPRAGSDSCGELVLKAFDRLRGA